MRRLLPVRTPDRVRDALAANPLFAACGPHELAALAAAATVIEVGQHAVLATQGRPGHEFAIVLSGVAAVDVDGRTVATVGAGECFGEMALLDDGPRTATVTAAMPMTLAVIGRPEFTALLDRSPSLTRALLTALVRRVRELSPAAA